MREDVSTTSKLFPTMLSSWCRAVLFQRESGMPLTYQFEPLSASIIPWVFRACRMTRFSALKPEMSTLALSRTRVPIGGAEALVLLEAKCRAGHLYACWVTWAVN